MIRTGNQSMDRSDQTITYQPIRLTFYNDSDKPKHQSISYYEPALPVSLENMPSQSSRYKSTAPGTRKFFLNNSFYLANNK